MVAGCCVKFPALSKSDEEARKASMLFCNLNRSARKRVFFLQFFTVKSGVIKGAAHSKASRWCISVF